MRLEYARLTHEMLSHEFDWTLGTDFTNKFNREFNASGIWNENINKIHQTKKVNMKTQGFLTFGVYETANKTGNECFTTLNEIFERLNDVSMELWNESIDYKQRTKKTLTDGGKSENKAMNMLIDDGYDIVVKGKV